ncbi:MAG: hypothetical protein U5K79_24205 [Cyclobacteriaceae bacterium]|nr:hypothetical protein [Cyclobacteriaceae bacterium]
MKKITYLFLSAMLIMFFACTQEDVQLGPASDEQGKASTLTGPVFKVYPNGVDDTKILSRLLPMKSCWPGAWCS